jgi:hypothetical protein
MIKLGTCIFRDEDGQLKTIDVNKVVAVIEVKNPQLKESGNLEMIINCETTENCTEIDKKYIERQLKEITKQMEKGISL